MPEKPFTVITYAASASLAAIALIYFFNPNQLLDSESSKSTASARKKGVVGLSNPANDCFINSILQSLAGLGDLRLYLIRELHRRELDGPAIYAAVPEEDVNRKPVDVRKMASLQSGEVTQGLKYMIDNLNERPIYKKTISAGAFVQVLEHAFETRISKSQQDAQELLQIVAERLAEEYYAGREARKRARQGVTGSTPSRASIDEIAPAMSPLAINTSTAVDAPLEKADEDLTDKEEGFPLEGHTEAQTECQHCHFMPKAHPTSFVMLNLMVPQKSSTTLNECFDAHFKLEYIDDYKCDKCRLEHAHDTFSATLARATSAQQKASLQVAMAAIQKSLENDPEIPPKNVQLPDISEAPKRKISRHVQITSFPKVLIIHLSRSIFDMRSSSRKNTSKVAFPERLPLGGILNRRHYKLLGMVSHRGTHNSGHYESFRRQHVYAPISTPHVPHPSGPYRSPRPGSLQSPNTPRTQSSIPPNDPRSTPTAEEVPSTASRTPSLSSPSASPPSTRPSSGSTPKSSVSSAPPPPRTSSIPTAPQPAKRSFSSSTHDTSLFARHHHHRRKAADRWWRISDEKVKECKTDEVLGMQKDVYMLFYEMER